jgi:hypothetical protein
MEKLLKAHPPKTFTDFMSYGMYLSTLNKNLKSVSQLKRNIKSVSQNERANIVNKFFSMIII